MKYVLEPFGRGSKYLTPIEIDINGETKIIHLGRSTGRIYKSELGQRVSRQHAEICMVNQNLYLVPNSTKNSTKRLVHLNGIPCNDKERYLLKLGDKISMLGDSGYFNFELSMDVVLEAAWLLEAARIF